MDDLLAQLIADEWSGGGGLVPRGPKAVLAVSPATPSDVERHTGRRPSLSAALWRIEIGGRFLRSGGLVYPGGVPFPEELQRRTAVIANEVWLYADEGGDVLGAYWWPDAVRRPIASRPRDDFSADQVVRPDDVGSMLDFALRLRSAAPWKPVVAAVVSPGEAVVFLTQGSMPDPLNEMLAFEQGGLTLRARCEQRPDLEGFARDHQPPYRRIRTGTAAGIGREPGRVLGPQTWPWPGEIRWWEEGVSYELRGFVPLATLQEVAATRW